jgi:hypothetical protein
MDDLSDEMEPLRRLVTFLLDAQERTAISMNHAKCLVQLHMNIGSKT